MSSAGIGVSWGTHRCAWLRATGPPPWESLEGGQNLGAGPDTASRAAGPKGPAKTRMFAADQAISAGCDVTNRRPGRHDRQRQR